MHMDAAAFSSLRCLPDPVLGEDGHYLPFNDVFGKPTTEKDRPSLKLKSKNHFHTVPQNSMLPMLFSARSAVNGD